MEFEDMTTLDDVHRIHIEQYLATIIKGFHVTILFAVESGSRLWGFHSPTSDFDVRFVYQHPLSHYLSISPSQDTIEFKSEDHTYDLVGWDVKKFAQLLSVSNPSAIEWIWSHQVYLHRSPEFFTLASHYFSPERFAKHHQSLCKSTYDKYIKDKSETGIKRYLYCLRSYYSSIFVQKKNIFPPLVFTRLLHECATFLPIPREVQELLDMKVSMPEKTMIPVLPTLNAILESFTTTRIGLVSAPRSLELINTWLISQLKSQSG